MVAAVGNIPILDPTQNTGIGAMMQGMQMGFAPMQMKSEIAKNQAIAQMNAAHAGYFDQYGNYRGAQAENMPDLMQAQAARQNALAQLYPALFQRAQAQAQQTQALTQPKVNLTNAQTQSTLAGGPRGQLIENMLQGQGGMQGLPEGLGQQVAIGTALQGATPEVKRVFEYNAAQGNEPLQKSINAANIKGTSNQILLRQQAGMEAFDAAVQPIMQPVGDAIAYYSGPGGALKFQGDLLKQRTGLGKPSPEYNKFVTALQTQIPLMADNAAKVLQVQRSDAMNVMLQHLVGPGQDPSIKTLASTPPEVVYDKLNAFSNYLNKEAQVGRNFVGPLSLDPNQQQGIETPPELKAPSATSNAPPPGKDPAFDAWYAKTHGGK